MLQRYLGNKTVLLDAILKLVSDRAPEGSLVCDAFSGSVAVSAALKRAGYQVATNDVNLLSWVYATAFVGQSTWPEIPPELQRNYKVRRGKDARKDWAKLITLVANEDTSDIPDQFRRSDIFHHYCEAGLQSSFESSRGQTGRRRFFSSDNARRIDAAFSRIRWWWKAGLINEPTRCLLTAILLDGIEKVSNTQGTYHDFPRDFVDSRALQPLRLILPEESAFEGPASNLIGRGEDSLEFIRRVPRHEVLYLDPPYNFRQYTAYYFLPNLLAEYPEIDDPDGYFRKIQYVRGQNMQKDFTSTFCKSKQFLPSLRSLIERADCRYVVLSYFDGKNHWSDFKEEGDTRGRNAIEDFLRTELFEPESLRCFPIARQNYQSYGGYRAVDVKEFLFVAEKRRTRGGGQVRPSRLAHG